MYLPFCIIVSLSVASVTLSRLPLSTPVRAMQTCNRNALSVYSHLSCPPAMIEINGMSGVHLQPIKWRAAALHMVLV